MNVPVYWVSWHDDVLARGYADQGLLEGLFSRSVWRPPSPITFEHHEVRGDLPGAGGVVVLPARHHVDDVARFVAQLDRMPWSLVILSGDEEWAFPYAHVTQTATRAVWTMQPVPAQLRRTSFRIPGGWYPDTDRLLADAGFGDVDAMLPWFFGGQVTHERRAAIAEVLRGLPHDVTQLVETNGYLVEGVPKYEYMRRMARAKVVPCPSGPCTVDTARALEAFEAGAVPVVDTRTPRGDDYDYWRVCFGDDFPAPRIADWSAFPDVLARELEAWPANANRCSAWWQRWKRDAAYALDDDVRGVVAAATDPLPRSDAPDDTITAIVTSSPTVKHPAVDDLVQTIGSIRERLPLAEIIVVFDGVRPEQEHLRDAYEEYQRRALWLCNHEWANVVPLRLDEWHHQAGAAALALDLVTTPWLLFVEHDTPLVGPIDWQGCVRALTTGDANMIRFHHETTILDVHRSMMVDDTARDVDGVQLHRSMQWWQRPHLASVAWYRAVLSAYVPPQARTMIEDRMYGVLANDWNDLGVSGWQRWRVWTYAQPDDAYPELGIKRSTHLDGRAGAPKYDMVFE